MGAINQEKLDAAYQSARALFFTALEKVGDPWAAAAYMLTLAPDDRAMVYPFLGQFPAFREFLDERQYEQLAAYNFSIQSKKWEASIMLAANDIRFDRLGLYGPAIRSSANSLNAHVDSLIADLLNNGFATAGYDGVYFFHDSHPVGDTTYDNLETHALSSTYYAAARAKLMKLCGDKAKFLQIRPTHLIVPPDLEGTAKAITDKEYDNAGASNPWYKTAQTLVLPGLTSTTAWFLADLSQELKPFVLQRTMPNTPAEVASLAGIRAADGIETSWDITDLQKKDKIYFGLLAFHQAGYGMWQTIFGSTGVA